MNDILSAFEIVAMIAAVVAPAIVINRLLAGADGPDLADLFAIPADPSWPRGVQEEEPVRWRVELLRQPTRAGDRPLGVAGARPGGQRAVGLGVETGGCT